MKRQRNQEMKYRNKKVKEATSEQLLFELFQRHERHGAPRNIEFCSFHKNICVGVGKHGHADIFIDNDDLTALNEMMAE